MPVVLRRSIGLAFDWLIVAIVCLSPYFLHRLFNPDFSDRFKSVFDISVDPASPMAAVILLAVSLVTPIPLIYLRILCKVLWRVPTPGELLCGYSAKAESIGIGAIFSHVWYGFLQYVVLMLSGAYVLAILVPASIVSLFAAPHQMESNFGINLITYCIFLPWNLLVLYQAFAPSSENDLQGTIDSFSEQTITVLRSPQRNSLAAKGIQSDGRD